MMKSILTVAAVVSVTAVALTLSDLGQAASAFNRHRSMFLTDGSAQSPVEGVTIRAEDSSWKLGRRERALA